MLVDVKKVGLTGKDAASALDKAGITVNKNVIPFDTESPFKASGIRIGTPAVYYPRDGRTRNGTNCPDDCTCSKRRFE